MEAKDHAAELIIMRMGIMVGMHEIKWESAAKF
jgi:hypothetical protein